MSWQIRKNDIPSLALGAKLLSCGGGGDTKTAESLLMSIMREDDVIAVKSITDLGDEWVAAAGIMGSIVLFNEDIPSGREGIRALRLYESVISKNVGALISIEMGGVNSLIPLVIAIQANLPVIDGDGMGRAFPELFMTAFHLSEIPLSPMVLQTHDTNRVIYDAENAHYTAEMAKVFTVKNRGHAHLVGYGAKGQKMKTSMIPGTLNLIFRLGNVLKSETSAGVKMDHMIHVFENSIYGKPQQIISGVVTEVRRWFEKGSLVGKFIVEGRSAFSDQRIEIEFKNEFISIKNGQYICTAPDLILVLNEENLIPYNVSEVQSGLFITIVAVPAPNILRTKDMLELVGPNSYGLACSYKPFQGDSGYETWN
ncbi:DUF917 domain-containing protein [Cytobacillus firmus]|uniref:DUF917 domain-containing protein n=1 Tax=Cytobacillus firmus TaxID=1399 RepID=UPI0015805609|nr:DUF917 domain-containing protein [Cytobacillus firmus]MDD9313731.1 DUF917 domain-containing protein [Cytobacillus firmus]NUH83928.1 DUF917 family protein [Cytobacillus firmus]